MIPPPFRFGAVEADVFRSAQPTLKNYRFLSRLKLRTIVSIAPEGPMEDEAMFCREHAAQVVTIRAELYREEHVTVSSQQVAQVLSILVDADRLPALVHCPDGRVLSGVVLWCLRRLQCWDDRASAAEFTRFSGGLPSLEVEKFVESFGEEVTIPPNVPRWLWGGDRAHWHPFIRVRHQPPLEVFEPEPIPSHQILRGEACTRTDYLRMRRGHMYAHNKLPGATNGGGRTGGRGVIVRGQRAALAEGSAGPIESSARGRPPTSHSHACAGAMSPRGGFSQAVQDVSILVEEEDEGPKLSRAVQALALEGLEGTSYDDGNLDTRYHQQQRQHQTHHRNQQASTSRASAARRSSRGGGGRVGVGGRNT